MNTLKVLIAEDEENTIEIMSNSLKRHGYEILQARNGQEALDKINAEDPDIIVLDLMMPKVDGFEVLKQLRSEHTPEDWQPIIVVSALADVTEFDDEEFFSMADYYIPKPCRMKEVLKAVNFMSKAKEKELEFGRIAYE